MYVCVYACMYVPVCVLINLRKYLSIIIILHIETAISLNVYVLLTKALFIQTYSLHDVMFVSSGS